VSKKYDCVYSHFRDKKRTVMSNQEKNINIYFL